MMQDASIATDLRTFISVFTILLLLVCTMLRSGCITSKLFDIVNILIIYTCISYWGCAVVVATFATINLRGPRFKPRPGQKFETRFQLHAHPMLHLWDQNIEYQSQSKPGNPP